MNNLVSTYRLQFNKDFSFATAERLVDYFDLLGVGTVYASPINTAVPGSAHGYDVTDPDSVNPELGGKVALQRLLGALATRHIGWMQDIVPNHMAFHHGNGWLQDVLEKGRCSAYAEVFDIEWDHPDLAGQIMAPILGDDFEQVVDDGHLRLAWRDGTFHFVYYEHSLPLRFESVRKLFVRADATMPAALRSFIEDQRLADQQPDASYLNGAWEQCKQGLAALCEETDAVDTFLQSLVERTGEDRAFLRELAAEQHYRLVHWQETEKRVGYRRFFTVNDLICLRMEDIEVFKRWHRWLTPWLEDGKFTALRIDHIDGLRDPGQYLQRLRKWVGDAPAIIVEKILAVDEALPTAWPVQGSTGYEFLAQVNHLLTHTPGIRELETFYTAITATDQPLEEQAYDTRKLILNQRMRGEWENLVTLFYRLPLLLPRTKPPPRESVKAAIGEFLLAMPVYRFYHSSPRLGNAERDQLLEVVARAHSRDPLAEEGLEVLTALIRHAARADDLCTAAILQFLSRMMQLAGPLMAKGVEDTLMYRYGSFVPWNEVGDHPAPVGMDTTRFHAVMQTRQTQWPLSLNATSSHDTKRGEDVRARLNVISEMPGQWADQVQRWMQINDTLKQTCEGVAAPSKAEEYLLYQTLLGVLPFSQAIDEPLIERLEQYMVKALREAKVNSAWNAPRQDWEDATKAFIRNILDPRHDFLAAFLPYQKIVAHFGIFNSLTQLALKATCPGVPDFYRGTELWDLNLVDPDNRRSLDFAERENILRQMIERHRTAPDTFLSWLLHDASNGRIKLWLTHCLLRHRRAHPDLFVNGTYRPLSVIGPKRDHILAFARCEQGAWNISIVPLQVSLICTHPKGGGFCRADWQDTRVVLPDDAPVRWTDVVTGAQKSFDQHIAVGPLLAAFPVGLFYGKQAKVHRDAGVLMHVSSLPGTFATGDFGPEAYQFVDFLQASGHTAWQMLPLVQTTSEGGWSPYSALSAFAGNIMFVSPLQLAAEGLVMQEDLDAAQPTETDAADFSKALAQREVLTAKAYETFQAQADATDHATFDAFCHREREWLDDYALFLLFKKLFAGKPWIDWPESVRDRTAPTLAEYSNAHSAFLQLEKFRQFLFFQQWQKLRHYAAWCGIEIIGDLPIYIGYDTVDVWTHPHLFKLDENRKMAYVAGVPPDAFSVTGQLWGMPVFDWEALAKENYSWWIRRIGRNLQLYDRVRLDHFRAFCAYWQVPAGKKTAVDGAWIEGPGAAFFAALQKHYPEMPFIAEDLGEIDDTVYRLRDQFGLPGMAVLQFAFKDNLGRSVHAPHNHHVNSVVYTGTHDNNTVRGWFENELDRAGKYRLQLYGGKVPTAENCADHLCRMAWSSTACLAIVPMQDLLGLGPEAQMNRPASTEDNWIWRLASLKQAEGVTTAIRERLQLFGRD